MYGKNAASSLFLPFFHLLYAAASNTTTAAAAASVAAHSMKPSTLTVTFSHFSAAFYYVWQIVHVLAASLHLFNFSFSQPGFFQHRPEN